MALVPNMGVGSEYGRWLRIWALVPNMGVGFEYRPEAFVPGPTGALSSRPAAGGQVTN